MAGRGLDPRQARFHTASWVWSEQWDQGDLDRACSARQGGPQRRDGAVLAHHRQSAARGPFVIRWLEPRESARGCYHPAMEFDHLPGGSLVRQGLEDLESGRDTEAALLVLVGSPRLGRLGIAVASPAPPQVEHRLYARLAAQDPDTAHSRYNALIRLLVSFERAAECAS